MLLKEYIAEIKIGVQTRIFDTENQKYFTLIIHITEDFIKETLSKFVGEIEQKPPVFQLKNRWKPRL